jgi:TatD DNase family protein
MILTDTHTHLYAEQFDEDRDQMMKRAFEQGVKRFFVPAIDSSYYQRMFELEQKYTNQVFLMAGLHPTHVGENYRDELQVVEKMLASHKFYAVGEIGIDLYWDKSFLDQQLEAFKIQIEWAKIRNMPIVIHCRDAFDEIFSVMDEMNDDNLNGIFHCFTGNEDQANRILNYGFKLGIGGVVTFKNGGLDKFLSRIDLAHLVLETDAPYLAPTPFRGKRNESSYLSQVLSKLTEIYQLSAVEIAEITTQNSKDVFGI